MNFLRDDKEDVLQAILSAVEMKRRTSSPMYGRVDGHMANGRHGLSPNERHTGMALLGMGRRE